jgi:hypothetical protein
MAVTGTKTGTTRLARFLIRDVVFGTRWNGLLMPPSSYHCQAKKNVTRSYVAIMVNTTNEISNQIKLGLLHGSERDNYRARARLD